MNCKEAQHNLYNFINGELDEETLEAFINHVNCCRECYEELEIYFTLTEGMKRLDESGNISINYHDELYDRLKKSLSHIVIKKRLIRYGLILGILLCVSGTTLGWIEKQEYDQSITNEIIKNRDEYYFYNSVKDIMYNNITFDIPALKENTNESE